MYSSGGYDGCYANFLRPSDNFYVHPSSVSGYEHCSAISTDQTIDGDSARGSLRKSEWLLDDSRRRISICGYAGAMTWTV